MSERRELHYSDAKSDKFWTIELVGASHSVHYGRVGTNGQRKTKDFDSEAKARASFAKLIAQKLKKGYAEASGSAPAPTPSAPTAAAQATKKTATKKATKKKATKKKATRRLVEGIDLPKEAAFLALWRDPDPLPRGKAKPLDRDKLLGRLRKWGDSTFLTSDNAWAKRLPSAMSRGEACLYLRALHMIQTGGYQVNPQVAADRLAALDEWDLDPDEILAMWSAETHQHAYWPDPGRATPVLRVLSQLLNAEQLFDWIRARLETVGHWDGSPQVAVGVVQLLVAYAAGVLPYLTREERRALLAKLEPLELPDGATMILNRHGGVVPWGRFCFAALLGHVEATRALVALWSDRALDPSTPDAASAGSVFVGGVGGAAASQEVAERLDFYPESEHAMRAWLANTGLDGLERARDAVLRTGYPGDLMRALLDVDSPRFVPHLLAIQQAKPALAKAVARWAKKRPQAWAEGLLRALAGEHAQRARDELSELARVQPEVFSAALEDEALPAELRAQGEAIASGSEAASEVSRDLPPALQAAFAAVQALGKPKAAASAPWLRAHSLVPLAVGGQELGEVALDAILRALYEAPLGAAPETEAERAALTLLAELRQRVPEVEGEDFAWQLYEVWRSNDAPSKQKWLLHALAHFGGDATVAQLTPLIRKWPGESQHQRAVLGLDLLRAIGSDAALSAIAGIAQKLKYRALKQRAGECLDEIALARGLTAAELADRLVPECGLDPEGQRSFDYGPRQFAFVLSPELVPMARDASGKLRKAPPKPGKSDDEALAPAALKEWRDFRKQVKDTLAIQVERLEQAMVSGRRWAPADFETLLRRHPLLRHVVPSLLWAAYGEGAPRPFRVTADALLDAAGAPLELGEGERVGVIHALELEPAARETWDERWDELGLLAPFPQLDREVLAPSADERKGDSLRELAGADTSPSQLRGSLIRAGWTRGAPQDAGLVCEHLKYFASADLTALALHEGLSVSGGDESWNPFARLERCLFLRGLHGPGDVAWFQGAGIPLAEVPELVLSEVLRDMQAIARRAEG